MHLKFSEIHNIDPDCRQKCAYFFVLKLYDMIKQGTFISDVCGLAKTQKNGCLQASVIHTIYRYPVP